MPQDIELSGGFCYNNKKVFQTWKFKRKDIINGGKICGSNEY